MDNYQIAIIGGHFSKSFEMTPKYKFIRSKNNDSKMSDIEIIEQKVSEAMDEVQIKLGSINVDVLEIMNYIKHGPDWHNKDINELYSYLKNTALNGVYLQQFLRKHDKQAMLIENFVAEKIRLKEQLIKGLKYVLISTTHMTGLEQILDICNYAKKYNPDCVTIVGGALIRQVFDQKNVVWALKIKEVLNEAKGKVDVFINERHGELSLIKLLNQLDVSDKNSLTAVPNIIFYDENGEVVYSDVVEEYVDIDSVSIDYGSIEGIQNKRYLSLLTSRGCPHKCKFCTYHNVFKTYEPKSFEVLKRELDSIPRDGRARHIRFADDNFAVNRDRLYKFCNMLIDGAYDFTWSCMSTPHSITEETAEIMKESGCNLVFIGVESANDKVLEKMNKTSRVKDYYRAVETLKKAGIETIASTIIGFPGETEESIEDNINFINNSGVDYFQVNLLNIMPSMEVFKERHQHGLKGLMYGWRHNTMDAYQAFEAMTHIILSSKNALTNGFGLSSVQATIEYLYSEGFNSEEIRKLFSLYTLSIKDKIRSFKGLSEHVDNNKLLNEFSIIYHDAIKRIYG